MEMGKQDVRRFGSVSAVHLVLCGSCKETVMLFAGLVVLAMQPIGVQWESLDSGFAQLFLKSTTSLTISPCILDPEIRFGKRCNHSHTRRRPILSS